MSTFSYPRVLAVLLVLWAIPAQAQVGDQPGYVLLKRVLGEVMVEVKGVSAPTPAVNDQRIAQQSIVTTAAQSSVILVFSNGATVTLGPRSILDVEEFVQDPFADEQPLEALVAEPTASRTRLNLTRGELIGTVRSLNKGAGSVFEVQTPAGAAGVRGTMFRIVFQPAEDGRTQFSLTVLEGEVGFAPPGGSLEAPQAIISINQRLLIDVIVDPQTGQVTILTPLAAMVPQPAPPAQIAALAQAVQQILEVLVGVVLPPSSSVDATGDTSAPGAVNNANDGSAAENPPPPPLPPLLGRPNPDLTPGDGVAGP